MSFSRQTIAILSLAILFVSVGVAFFALLSSKITLAAEQEEVVCEGQAPTCAGTTSSWTETQYKCDSNVCGARLLKRTRSCSSGEDTYQSAVCTELGWSNPRCISFSNRCGEWQETGEDQDPYKFCSGSTVWVEERQRPELECSAQKCYPAPTIKDLKDNSLLPKNVFEPATEKIKLPIHIGWSSVNNVLQKEKSVCTAQSYQYRITGGGITHTKSVLANATICNTEQGCRDAWEEAKESNDIAAMNRAKAMADELRGRVTDPSGDNTVNDSPPSATNPTYNFLTGNYDYVFNKDKEVTQDIVRRAFQTPDTCVLAPGTSYQIQIRSCDNKIATDDTCSPWNQPDTISLWNKSDILSFATSLAPELLSPYDPDWEGPRLADIDAIQNLETPLTLRWCKAPSVQSYRINLYAADSLILEYPIGANTPFYQDSPPHGGLGQIRQRLPYAWKIAACSGSMGRNCTSFSQLWKLLPATTQEEGALVHPASGSIINALQELVWRVPLFKTHVALRIQGNGVNFLGFFDPQRNRVLLRSIWEEGLRPTETYTWQVAPCAGNISQRTLENCKDEDNAVAWTSPWLFTITGEPPNQNTFTIAPSKNVSGQEVFAIPATLAWEGVPGAASYAYRVTEKGLDNTVASGFSNAPSATITHEEGLHPGTAYDWYVRACAEEKDRLSIDNVDGFCGLETKVEFTSLSSPEAPTIISPAGVTTVRPRISWSPAFGANYYSLVLFYEEIQDEPNKQQCAPLIGKNILLNSVPTPETSLATNIACFGKYRLEIRGCIATNTQGQCVEGGDMTTHMFEVKAPVAPTGFGGLVPCGRDSFNHSTPWDDRDPCGIEHIFLGIWTLINFILRQLIPIFLILGAAATGAVMYFLSYSMPELLPKIKAGWKAFGWGILVVLFSWFLLNLLLGLLGFDVTVFGRWYEITL